MAIQPTVIRNIHGCLAVMKRGFYVYAEPKVTAAQGIGRYIGRYIRHPVIADTRIVGYDGEQVSYYYEQCLEPGLPPVQAEPQPIQLVFSFL